MQRPVGNGERATWIDAEHHTRNWEQPVQGSCGRIMSLVCGKGTARKPGLAE